LEAIQPVDDVDDRGPAGAVGVVGADPLVQGIDGGIAVSGGEDGGGGVGAEVADQVDRGGDGGGGGVGEDVHGAGEVLGAGAGDGDLAVDVEAGQRLRGRDDGPV